MYTIKAYVDGKEYTIHDARVKALTVGGNPYFEIGDNINGSATFKVFPTHPYYDKVKKLTTDIVIYRDDEPEFYGRVLYDDEDFSGTKKVFVEGELAFLCDSIQRPKVYHNISVKAYVQDLSQWIFRRRIPCIQQRSQDYESCKVCSCDGIRIFRKRIVCNGYPVFEGYAGTVGRYRCKTGCRSRESICNCVRSIRKLIAQLLQQWEFFG